MTMKMRNTVLSISLLAVASFAIYFLMNTEDKNPSISLHDDHNITVVSWGGAYTDSQIKAYHEPYARKSSTVIKSIDYSGGLDEIRNQVHSGNIIWDVVDFEKADLIQACEEGLLVKIDPKDLPRGSFGAEAVDDFIPNAIEECGVANIVWAKIIAYDDTQFPNQKPFTLFDFFDTTNFPGKRGLKKTPKVNLERALIADGVSRDKVYDVLGTTAGIDRAFAKLDTIKNSIVWWESGAEPVKLLEDKKVSMTSAYNGRIYNAAIKQGKPFVIVWDHQFLELDYWGILKGTIHYQRAFDFLKYASGTRGLARITDLISYAPARKSSIMLVSDRMIPHMATAPENFATSIAVDYHWWAKNQDALTERFNVWLER